MNHRISLIAVVLVAVSMSAGHAAVFTNGSFESASIAVDTNMDSSTPIGAITGWVLNIGAGERMRYEDDFFGFLSPTDGVREIAFNNGQTTPGASISQTFDTVIGTQYVVTFDVGSVDTTNDNSGGGNLVLTASVDAAGASPVSTTIVVTDDPIVSSWSHTDQTLSFTASSISTTLTFLDESDFTQNADVLLDNVRLEVIPEPASLALLGIGGVMVIRRRRA